MKMDYCRKWPLSTCPVHKSNTFSSNILDSICGVKRYIMKIAVFCSLFRASLLSFVTFCTTFSLHTVQVVGFSKAKRHLPVTQINSWSCHTSHDVWQATDSAGEPDWLWNFPTHSSRWHFLPSIIPSPDFSDVMFCWLFFLYARIGCVNYVGTNF